MVSSALAPGQWDVVGHDAAITMLRQGVDRGDLAHAYLLSGPPQVGKGTIARELALALVCEPGPGEVAPCRRCPQCRLALSGSHPDVSTVARLPDKRDITVDQIRQMEGRVGLRPYQARRSVQIIREANLLNEAAANALLKTLEEPPGHALLLLTATDEEALPATIRSRCQALALRPVPPARIAAWLEGRCGTAPSQARTLAALSAGRPGWAYQAASSPQLVGEHDALVQRVGGLLDLEVKARVQAVPGFLDRDSFNENRQMAATVLDLLLRWVRDLLVIAEGLPELVVYTRHFERLEEQAARLTRGGIRDAVGLLRQAADDVERNVTPRLVLEALLVRLPTASAGAARRR